MESKTVLLKYQKSRKKVVIPVEKQTSELVYLEAAFRKLFNFEKQVNLIISFQRFDSDFDEFVDLEDGDELRHLETLNVVVTAVLVTPPQVSVTIRIRCRTCRGVCVWGIQLGLVFDCVSG